MTTKEIVSRLADKQALSKAETRRLVDTMVEQMTTRLIKRGAVRVSGLGTFQTEAMESKTEAQDVRFLPHPSLKSAKEARQDKTSASKPAPFIASQSERSETMMREFMNHFVSVIDKGLDDDRKVNIAGWGKFEIQPGDDNNSRQQKINFTPYKQLRQQLAKRGDKAPSQKDTPQDKAKASKKSHKETNMQKHPSEPKTGISGPALKWLSAGAAFLVGTVGAWFIFRNDD